MFIAVIEQPKDIFWNLGGMGMWDDGGQALRLQLK